MKRRNLRVSCLSETVGVFWVAGKLNGREPPSQTGVDGRFGSKSSHRRIGTSGQDMSDVGLARLFADIIVQLVRSGMCHKEPT